MSAKTVREGMVSASTAEKAHTININPELDDFNIEADKKAATTALWNIVGYALSSTSSNTVISVNDGSVSGQGVEEPGDKKRRRRKKINRQRRY